ncbi:carboxymuconolactone decarboxylase family protein [Mycobacterium sp. CVI_P3]|uniref:Carboxymuconolactone decarboxylase family protein n=1 Tax=Mycobacterium pinniadriaticum TaxID=2994102 RepID=A0ABT3SCX5_9MYCO|nr:carboxymuconolactone decarboxylase family protein [Mycobacterium pinniadriaticum]MCX2930944.1 carboxymuconolactone decarboxylase family protein [Mycobacterium pinniadriaticum]MCX2937368.1 carboxymuconolactone decarboxylase family protein [Mycobacterium pinniadriaticum]
MADDLDVVLADLVVQSPVDQQRLVGLVRATCGQTLSLPPLPAQTPVRAPETDAEKVVAEFAEQFSVDVSAVSDRQRESLTTLGPAMFGAVVQMFVADFLPRVRGGLEVLGLPVDWVPAAPVWDAGIDAADVLFNRLLPGVARLRSLDPVTTEVVRLRGAVAHNCRLCKSLRDGNALDAGGSESLYQDIEHYESSELLTDGQKAALRYADALIWSPARISQSVASGVREHFSHEQARELTLDVMRNASNKIAVALKADAARVEEGTERYFIDADGQTQFA